MRHSKINFHDRNGFTLVEILVAMTVLVLMVGLLAQVVSFAQVGLGNLGNSALRRQDAGTVLANMAKDLRASLQPMNRSFEGADPAAGQFQLLINPPGIPISNGGLANPNTIFWSATAPNSVGGTALVGYVVRWGTTPAGTPQPLLCRFLLGTAQSTTQLAAIQAGTDPTAQWVNSTLVANSTQADIDNGYQGWLADNVIALYARALDPNMNPITTAAPPIHGAVPVTGYAQNYIGGLKVSLDGPGSGSTLASGEYDSRKGYEYNSGGNYIDRFGPVLPAAVELVIVAAEPRDISRMTSPINFTSSTYYTPSADMWTNVNQLMTNLPPAIQKSARVYSTIVNL